MNGRSIRVALSAGLSAGLSATAHAQVFTIWVELPQSVSPGEVFAVEFWASVDDDRWIDGESAMAGFGIDAIGTGAATAVTPADLADWAAGFGVPGTVDGISVRGISGGQLANLFGGPLNPNIDLSNPIMLFSIDVTAGAAGTIAYTPANPNPHGALSFYPDSEDGATIIAPNDPGTTLVLEGATTRIVPGAGAVAVAVAGAAVGWMRRRRQR